MKTKKNSQHLLIVISAPSGCGKTTIINKLMERNPGIERSVSATTRLPRTGEKSGSDYFFLSAKEFLKEKRSGTFVEWARIYGYYYGTFKRFISQKLNSGKDLVLAIDVEGARQVRKKIKAVFIFIMPPSFKELQKRLVGRKSDPEEEIQRRLERARYEISCAQEYDYIVTNRVVGRTVKAIEMIIKKEKQPRSAKRAQKMISVK